MSDYHHKNMIGLGCYRRAGNGDVSDMNNYLMSYTDMAHVVPHELSLKFRAEPGDVSIHQLFRTTMERERANHQPESVTP